MSYTVKETESKTTTAKKNISLKNISVKDLKKVCFAHPTYSEGIYELICRIK